MISNIMVHLGNNAGEIELNMLKHMVLNSLRLYKRQFSSYGEMVIACESKSNWRYGAFPYYKASRKKDREESKLNWPAIFEGLNEIRSDLREYFPYRVISVDGCEADDIIGVLCHHNGSSLPGGEKIMIVSGDKDFKQLQVYLNVEQYDPVRKKKIVENDPFNFLTEQIIKGDKGDGIPNILSPDNCLVLNQRQGTMTAKRLQSYKDSVVSGVWDDSVAQRNYSRNEPLISLYFTPEHLKEKVLTEYDAQSGKTKSKIFNYLIKNRMKHLMEHLNDF